MKKMIAILIGVLAVIIVQTPLISQAGSVSNVEHKRMPSGNCASCHPDGGGTLPPGLRAFFNPSVR